MKEKNLNDYEKNVVLNEVIGILNQNERLKIGNSGIISLLAEKGIKTNYRSIRRVINYIRVNDIIIGLIADVYGYFISTTESEFLDYEERLKAIEKDYLLTRKAIARQRQNKFGKNFLEMFGF